MKKGNPQSRKSGNAVAPGRVDSVTNTDTIPRTVQSALPPVSRTGRGTVTKRCELSGCPNQVEPGNHRTVHLCNWHRRLYDARKGAARARLFRLRRSEEAARMNRIIESAGATGEPPLRSLRSLRRAAREAGS